MNGSNVVRTVTAYAAGGTAATLFVAAGVARLLQGMNYGGPTSQAFQYQGSGIIFTFVGWVIFVVLAINAYGALAGAGTAGR